MSTEDKAAEEIPAEENPGEQKTAEENPTGEKAVEEDGTKQTAVEEPSKDQTAAEENPEQQKATKVKPAEPKSVEQKNFAWIGNRKLITLAGIGLWFLVLLGQTGFKAIEAVLISLISICVLTAICTGTRSVTIQLVAALYFLGAFFGCISLFAERSLDLVGITNSHSLRTMIVPMIEETLMVAPLAVWLFKSRGGKYLFGLTDFLLMGTTFGAGFCVAEEAYIRMHGVMNPLSWFPLVSTVGDRIFGYYLMNTQAIWAGLALSGIGLTIMLRHKFPQAWIFLVVGIALGLLDHMTLNTLSKRSPDGFSQFLSVLLLKGWLPFLVYLAAAAFAISYDRMLLLKTPNRLKPLLQKGGQIAEIRFGMRSAAYAAHYYRHGSPQVKEDATRVTLLLLKLLIDRYKQEHPDFVPPRKYTVVSMDTKSAS